MKRSKQKRLNSKSVVGEKWERVVYQLSTIKRGGGPSQRGWCGSEVGQILLIGQVDRSRSARVLGLKETGEYVPEEN